MPSHSFDTEDASKYGILPAVILHNIRFWTEKNRANNRHCYEGKTWVYNSVSAWVELFPYATKDQIRRAIEKLREEGVLEVGNFNQSAYDRTAWYCLSCQIQVANLPNGNGKTSQPIPDINTDTNQIDLYGESPKRESKPRRVTKVYGEFKNVKLTDDELKKLQDKWIDWKEKLEIFSTDKELHGYKYTNDYLALLKWRFNDVIPKQAEQKRPTFNDSIPLV